MAGARTLDTLRQDIDRVDTEIHDLLMQRARMVEEVRIAKNSDATSPLCPGREAEILRRLVARHQGPFPKLSLIRIWREMLGSMVGLESDFSVAVFMPQEGAGYLEMARDTYGVSTPMTAMRSTGQVVRAVAEGSAMVGVLPMPDAEKGDPWWLSLVTDSADAPRIIGHLPFANGVPHYEVEALAIGRMKVDPTGYDRSWLVVETKPDISRGRMRSVLGAAGFEQTNHAHIVKNEGNWLQMVEVAGAIATDDRRLSRLSMNRDPVLRAVVLGNYPVPFSDEDLAD